MPKIGSVIRTLREQKGLTQADLATRAGLNQPYLSRLETLSRERVDARALSKIAAVLGVSVEEIYITAGLQPSDDPAEDLRWKQLQRVFRELSRANRQSCWPSPTLYHLSIAQLSPPLR